MLDVSHVSANRRAVRSVNASGGSIAHATRDKRGCERWLMNFPSAALTTQNSRSNANPVDVSAQASRETPAQLFTGYEQSSVIFGLISRRRVRRGRSLNYFCRLRRAKARAGATRRCDRRLGDSRRRFDSRRGDASRATTGSRFRADVDATRLGVVASRVM